MPATRDQIADTFERHVGRFGYAKATVEDVAAELGISKKTIYEHFSSKRDLYLYVVERVSMAWRSELRASITDVPTWGAKLEAVMAMVIAGARQHIEETAKSDWQQEYEIVGEALIKAVDEVVHEILRAGTDAGEFALRDSDVANRLVRVLVLEYTMMIRDEPQLDLDADVVAAVRRFMG